MLVEKYALLLAFRELLEIFYTSQLCISTYLAIIFYSKASYSTASYSTDLDIARFLIGSKITQIARFLVIFTSIARFLPLGYIN